MAEGYARHDLVRADPAAWSALLRARPDLADLPHLPDWSAMGRPLIVRRFVPGEARDRVPLGLPLPPADGKRRIGLALPGSDLVPVRAPTLTDCAASAPEAWRPALRALAALGTRHGVAPRPFGGLLWQAVTALAYLTPASDLDLLWPCDPPVPAGLLDGLAEVAAAAPMRIDGEILLPVGGVHWRELREAQARAVLVKRLDRVEAVPVAGLRAAVLG